MVDKDPDGLRQHESGAKLDDGKNRIGLVFTGFNKALVEVSKIGTFGSKKYTDLGFLGVTNGESRYKDAMLRHLFADMSGEEIDKETGLTHLGAVAWNALAMLEFRLMEKNND